MNEFRKERKGVSGEERYQPREPGRKLEEGGCGWWTEDFSAREMHKHTGKGELRAEGV